MNQRRGLSPIERLAMRVEMIEDSSREMRRRLKELETAWIEFVPVVSDRISRQVVIPALIDGLANSLRLPASLDAKDIPDPLSVAGLPGRKAKGGG